jgi:hypothetical protein
MDRPSQSVAALVGIPFGIPFAIPWGGSVGAVYLASKLSQSAGRGHATVAPALTKESLF